MHILVTGGLGTVGACLVRMLREAGHRVLSLDQYLQPDQHAFSLRPDREEPGYVRADLGEFRQLERVFSTLGPFDLVYNCAAEFGRWNGEDYYETLWRTNVIGTKHLIRLQEERGFRLVHFSSSEVYGDYPDLMLEPVLDEHPIRQMNDYAMTKWVNEMQLRNSAELFGTEHVIIRLFNTYGPGEWYSPYRSVNCRFLYCALHGLPFTVFRGHSRTSTYLEDTVRALARVAENFIPGAVYNVAGTTLHTIEELAEAVLEVTGAPAALVQFKESEHLTTTRKLVDAARARAELGLTETVDMREGLRRTAAWMRQAYGV
ncbi:NAD-dependent epimerase/dehydratase family protein [Megalodesulfovibrio paquesii]